jgi:hypothetical protein
MGDYSDYYDQICPTGAPLRWESSSAVRGKPVPLRVKRQSHLPKAPVKNPMYDMPEFQTTRIHRAPARPSPTYSTSANRSRLLRASTARPRSA